MAAVPVTLVGTFTTDSGQATNGTFQGLAVITGLGVGGGPIVPPANPPGIWPSPPEGIAPHPEHPIAPGGPPPGVWPNPPEGTAPIPEHPIVLPDPPTGQPPDGPVGPDGFIKSPPPQGGWGYHPQYHWMYDPGPSGMQPHRG